MAIFTADPPRIVADTYGPHPASAWRSVPWQQHLRQVIVHGRRVNLVDLGEGEQAVVFVHGLGANWQSWLENLPEVAAAGHRVVAMDLPGFGFSEMPAREVSIPCLGEAVVGILDVLGIDEAVVVGNSMGGFVGIEIALVAPERLGKLVLVSAAALWGEGFTARPAIALNRVGRPYAARFYAQWEMALRHPRLRLPALVSAGIRHPRAFPLDLCYELMRAAGAPGSHEAVQAMYDYRLRDRLTEIGVPTLVAWGTRDPLVPLWHAFEYQALIPDSRVVLFRDTGHVPHLERPARFNEELLQYLGQEGVGVTDDPQVEVA